MAGTQIARAARGFRPVAFTTTSARYAARTIRSPCAMFTRRMTPKISDRPMANKAYSPPSRTPWINVSSQPLIRRPLRSNPEVRGGNLLAGEVPRTSSQRHPSLLQTVQPLRDPHRQPHILLDDQQS